jgi:hypothetical protein
MGENPYEPSKALPASDTSGRRTGMHWVTAILIGASIAPVAILLLVAGMCFFFWLNEPPSKPGGPDIGLGILSMACALNLPVMLAWIAWLAWRVGAK